MSKLNVLLKSFYWKRFRFVRKMSGSQRDSASQNFFWTSDLAKKCDRKKRRYRDLTKQRQLDLLAPYSRCQGMVKDEVSRSGNRRSNAAAETSICGCDGYKPKDTKLLLDSMDSDNIPHDGHEACKKCGHTKSEFTI